MTEETIAPDGGSENKVYTTPGADELNLAEFPLSILGKRPDGVKTLEFCDTVFDRAARKEVTRKLTITGSELYGLPKESDDDVLVVLIHLSNINKFNNATVHFSRYQLIQLLGWSHSGKSYDRLETSLRRWLGVTLYYDNAWWDRKHAKWVSQDFHIFSKLSLYDQRSSGAQEELPLSSFTWHETVFASLSIRHTKPLDLNDYFSLTLAPAKRMYRFLDKRFGARKGNVWRFDLREFACEHIGFSRGYDSAQLKRKMQPSLAALEKIGFLKSMAEAKRYPKGAQRGKHFIVVEKAPKRKLSPLEKELVLRKVDDRTAEEIVASYDAADINTLIEVFDWLVETKDKRIGKNPPGYLVSSIRTPYSVPADYVPKAEREKAKRRAATQLQEKKARAEQEKKDALARRTQREHIERCLAALTPEEKAELTARALANAEPVDRERMSDISLTNVMRRLLIERQLLRERPLPAEAD